MRRTIRKIPARWLIIGCIALALNLSALIARPYLSVSPLASTPSLKRQDELLLTGGTPALDVDLFSHLETPELDGREVLDPHVGSDAPPSSTTERLMSR